MTRLGLKGLMGSLSLPVSVNWRVYLLACLSAYLIACRVCNWFRKFLKCCGKNPLNFGFDPSQNGRMATIVEFCYNITSKYSKWMLICRAWLSRGPTRDACSLYTTVYAGCVHLWVRLTPWDYSESSLICLAVCKVGASSACLLVTELAQFLKRKKRYQTEMLSKIFYLVNTLHSNLELIPVWKY